MLAETKSGTGLVAISNGVCEDVEDPVCDHFGPGVHRLAIDEHDELVAAESSDGVARTKRVREPIGDCYQAARRRRGGRGCR